VEALVEAMQDCLDAPVEKLVRMGEAAQERVRLRHSVDIEAAKLVKLFEGAIAKGRSANETAPLTADDMAPGPT
jgi:hypothetical protein